MKLYPNSENEKLVIAEWDDNSLFYFTTPVDKVDRKNRTLAYLSGANPNPTVKRLISTQ